MKIHPAANFFPMMDEDRLAELVESIKTIGLKIPIVTLDGMILDGRNRMIACEKAGVKPRFVEIDDVNPFKQVWAMNATRRDLKEDRRLAIGLKIQKASDEWEQKQDKAKGKANAARSAAARTRPRSADGTMSKGSSLCPNGQRLAPTEHAHERLARETGGSANTAHRILAVANKRPDLLDEIAEGKISVTEAQRQIKKETLAEKIEALPSAKYRVIYADPPWQYNDTRAGVMEQSAAEDHYPTMSVPELSVLGVAKLAEPDAVLFLWATFPLMPDALEVARAWGFKYKTAFVWHKMRPNFGHYHDASAELLLLCTKGSCTPDSDKREHQVQQIERGKHSAKPEEIRQMIQRLYLHGKKIELFRRGDAAPGWDAWGNEVTNGKSI